MSVVVSVKLMQKDTFLSFLVLFFPFVFFFYTFAAFRFLCAAIESVSVSASVRASVVFFVFRFRRGFFFFDT